MENKIIDQGFATFSLGDDGIIRVVYSQGVEITLKEVQIGAASIKQLCQGKRKPVFVDARGMKNMSREARLFSRNKDSATPFMNAVASLNRPVIRVLGQLFQGLIAPPYPIKFFDKEEDAMEWLKQYVEGEGAVDTGQGEKKP